MDRMGLRAVSREEPSPVHRVTLQMAVWLHCPQDDQDRGSQEKGGHPSALAAPGGSPLESAQALSFQAFDGQPGSTPSALVTQEMLMDQTLTL